ncbi:MAG: DUF2306 domain-containing protein [Bacteroidota bacterium]
MKRAHLFLMFLLVGAISMIGMSMHYFLGEDSGILAGKTFRETWWYRLAFFLHIGGGLVAISTGPFQFMRNRKHWHVPLGYLYATSVGISSLAGLWIAPFAMGGWTAKVGFFILGLLWGGSLWLAMRALVQRNLPRHRIWMLLNYALTFSSITQRSILALALITPISFITIYQVSAWLCWVLNLSIAASIIHKTKIA